MDATEKSNMYIYIFSDNTTKKKKKRFNAEIKNKCLTHKHDKSTDFLSLKIVILIIL